MAAPKRFCRIHESDKYGQILLRLDTNYDGEPCITMTVNSNDMYVSNSISGFNDDITDKQLLECLDGISNENLEEFASRINNMLGE
ncbi:hypothetical protein VPHK392_0047 [Vibrio phage K392]